MVDAVPAYPATFTFDPPEKVANWRPLVSWLLVIPHFLVLYVLQLVSEVVGIISWFVILFTGKMPDGLANIQAMYLRYALRTYTYAGFMREEYPPFTFASVPADPGDDARVRIDIQPQLTDRNRLTVGLRFIWIIPQAIVLAVLAIGFYVVMLIAFFAVLFTGKWPEGLRGFAINFWRWWLRVSAYGLLLTDVYPPFELA
jgi:Domain of unknown function (DUF4389)